MNRPATPGSISIGSRWLTSDGRVFVVTEKKPFGVLEIEQEDRRTYGCQTTQKRLRQNFKEAA